MEEAPWGVACGGGVNPGSGGTGPRGAGGAAGPEGEEEAGEPEAADGVDEPEDDDPAPSLSSSPWPLSSDAFCVYQAGGA
jgi:hypothetical protein